MLSIERLNEILNHHFGEPFLSSGTVKSELMTWGPVPEGKPMISITIGRRDVQIGEDGEVYAAGTSLM